MTDKEFRIEELDKNFLVDTDLRKEGVTVYDACLSPFRVCGLIYPKDAGGRFRRMPEEVALRVNPGVAQLHAATAGGRVLFATDSQYIAVYAEMPMRSKSPHFAMTGSVGFDLMERADGRHRYLKTFKPPFDIKEIFTGQVILPEKKMRELVINFPLYSHVSKLHIILEEGATVKAAKPYAYEKPVVYYGSSITQGGCASRPSNSYQGMLSARLDCNYINLGFSGNALGEDVMADHIAGLDMSVFVYDYDHNAPTPAHLRATHERMFRRIREKHPDLPIICMTMPLSRISTERQYIVRQTVENAKARGDKNVYFLNPSEEIIRSGVGDCFSVDGVHPTDLGFYCMANALEPLLRQCLEQSKGEK